MHIYDNFNWQFVNSKQHFMKYVKLVDSWQSWKVHRAIDLNFLKVAIRNWLCSRAAQQFKSGSERQKRSFETEQMHLNYHPTQLGIFFAEPIFQNSKLQRAKSYIHSLPKAFNTFINNRYSFCFKCFMSMNCSKIYLRG